MSIRKLDPGQWSTFFDTFSQRMLREHRTDYAEIRVLSAENGAHRETAWLPLRGITFDRKDALLEIQVENMDHLILRPTEIYLDELDGGVLAALRVTRADGTVDLVELR